MRLLIVLTILLSMTMATSANAGILGVIDRIIDPKPRHHRTTVVHHVPAPVVVHKVHTPVVVHKVHTPKVVHRAHPPQKHMNRRPY